MIELQGLSCRFGDRLAVDNLSLKVESGRFCTLIGTSGCGKSTTLKMINRLIEPTAGRVLINGEDVSQLPGEQLRRRMGYAIQGIGLFPHRTIFDNIATVPRLLGWSTTDIQRRVIELLQLLHLDHATFAGQYPHQLSGGEQQRVGVARALAARPQLLLMDEPFGALDPLTREHLQRELKEIQQLLGITVIMVTHDLEEAVKLADLIAVMDSGRLLQVAAPDQLLRSPQAGFVSALVGRDDRALRLLSLKSVSDVMARCDGSIAAREMPAVRPDTSLRDALALLIWQSSTTLQVVDDAGRPLGCVTLDQLLGEGAENRC